MLSPAPWKSMVIFYELVQRERERAREAERERERERRDRLGKANR